MDRKVIIAGAGPAGMMAAITAARRGLQVIVLEKNSGAGKKLLITGKGRCNITNDTDINGLIRNIPGNGVFLYSSFNRFGSREITGFFNSIGVATKIERGDRVFPVSDDSGEVAGAMYRAAVDSGAKFIFNHRMQPEDIKTANSKIKAISVGQGNEMTCDSLIIATGGASYPSSGSTGDGYSIASALGHSVTQPRPSLVPLITAEKWPAKLQGLTLKNTAIKLTDNKGAALYKDFGEVLFTHYGISGPVILSASRHLPVSVSGCKGVKVIIDLKPALSLEKLDARLQRDFEKYSKKIFANALDELLPAKMIPVFINLCGIPHDKPVNQISRSERLRAAAVLKSLELNITGTRGFGEAIVTSGGVCINEIEPSTMASKLINGLFFAGEVMDLDGYSGGFNLSIAFSTGCTAGSFC